MGSRDYIGGRATSPRSWDLLLLAVETGILTIHRYSLFRRPTTPACEQWLHCIPVCLYNGTSKCVVGRSRTPPGAEGCTRACTVPSGLDVGYGTPVEINIARKSAAYMMCYSCSTQLGLSRELSRVLGEDLTGRLY